MSLSQLNKHLLLNHRRKAMPNEMPPAELPREAKKVLNKINRKNARDERRAMEEMVKQQSNK